MTGDTSHLGPTPFLLGRRPARQECQSPEGVCEWAADECPAGATCAPPTTSTKEERPLRWQRCRPEE
eukprot:4925-Amphidinium_carterae.1